jgi:hypothetical protein
MSINRPVFDRLPDRGYRDNVVADALTRPYDDKLKAVADRLEKLWSKLTLNYPVESFKDTIEPPGVRLTKVDHYVDPFYTGVSNGGCRVTVAKQTTFHIRALLPPIEVGVPQILQVFSVLPDNVTVRDTTYTFSFTGIEEFYHKIVLPPGNYVVAITAKYSIYLRNKLAGEPATIVRAGYSVGTGRVTLGTTGNIINFNSSYTSAVFVSAETEEQEEQVRMLDYIAALVGYPATYWSTGWDDYIKIYLLRNVKTIQGYKGTLLGLKKVLDSQQVPYKVYSGASPLTLPFTVTSPLGVNTTRSYITILPTESRYGRVFLEAQRAVAAFTPPTGGTRVTYNKFYAGLSVAGDPVL